MATTAAHFIEMDHAELARKTFELHSAIRNFTKDMGDSDKRARLDAAYFALVPTPVEALHRALRDQGWSQTSDKTKSPGTVVRIYCEGEFSERWTHDSTR